jgi:acyl-CoA reductase-like NAD-dependent aldehyde dehydrogenase
VVPVFPQRGFDYTRGEPYGVVGVISSRAGALPEVTVTVAAALAAGNGVVLKPSERASGTALRLAEMCVDAGLPPGLLSVVTGGDVVGEALVSQPGLDGLSFSGRPGAAAAQLVRPVTFRLVGQSVAIVFADSDPERSVDALRRTAADGLGPRGTSPLTRVLVEHDVYDDVLRRVLDHRGDAATANSGGPAPSVIPFRTDEDALALANESPDPRSVLLYTSDLARAHGLAEGLDAATVSINRSRVPVEEPDIRQFRRIKNVFIDLSA